MDTILSRERHPPQDGFAVRLLTDALNAVLAPEYAADKDGGEHVKLRKKSRDAANFSVEITFNAPGFSVILED
jgi:hypothetical protein